MPLVAITAGASSITIVVGIVAMVVCVSMVICVSALVKFIVRRAAPARCGSSLPVVFQSKAATKGNVQDLECVCVCVFELHREYRVRT